MFENKNILSHTPQGGKLRHGRIQQNRAKCSYNIRIIPNNRSNESDHQSNQGSELMILFLHNIGRAVWTDYGSRIVSTVQLIHLLGACILYLILVANFLEAIFPTVLLNANQCMLLAGVLVFPTAFLSNLSNIAWLSLTSIASLNVVFTVLICYSLKEVHEWRVSSLPVASLEGTSISVCIIMFSYVAHPYLPKIEGNMKKPQQFKFVTNIAFTIATITKIIFGFTLACHYGADTKQRVTSNVKTYQLKLCIDALLALSGLFSFALPLNVIMNIVQKSELKLFAILFPIFRSKHEMTWSEKGLDLAMRVILVCATTTIAMMLPEFSLLMAIFGSFTAVCLVILFPIHFYAKLHREKMSVRSMLLNYSIVVLFVGVGATGFITSIQALRAALKTADT